MTPRERYAFRRRNGQCVTCGMVAARHPSSLGAGKPRFKARCVRCAGRLTRAYRRRRATRRAARRTSDAARYKRLRATAAGRLQTLEAGRVARGRRKHREICVDCRWPPAPDRIRCPRHLRLARDRQRTRRTDAQKTVRK
jgi:hypothetical protein